MKYVWKERENFTYLKELIDEPSRKLVCKDWSITLNGFLYGIALYMGA